MVVSSHGEFSGQLGRDPNKYFPGEMAPHKLKNEFFVFPSFHSE
jgi:hypothetical protein